MKAIRQAFWFLRAVWHIWRRDVAGPSNLMRYVHHHMKAQRCAAKMHNVVHGELP
jgi:hypothetical protein